MPAINPRITITLKPEIHAILRRLSALTGNSQSAMVGELLESSQPVFERMAVLLEAAERLKAEGMQGSVSIRKGLDDAQARLESQLGLLLEDMDTASRPLLDAAEKVARRAGRGTGGAGTSTAQRASATPISNRGVTPRESKAKQVRKAEKPVAKKAVRRAL